MIALADPMRQSGHRAAFQHECMHVQNCDTDFQALDPALARWAASVRFSAIVALLPAGGRDTGHRHFMPES